jgi:hypothetical protein
MAVAASGQTVLMADTKTAGGPVLSYSPAEWEDFIAGSRTAISTT